MIGSRLDVARELKERIEDQLTQAHPRSRFKVWLTDGIQVRWVGGERVSLLEIQNAVDCARSPF